MSLFEAKKELLLKYIGDTGDWASYRPSLISALAYSNGPILELGLGIGSTPMLQEFSTVMGVPLWSFDNKIEWAKKFFASDRQVIFCSENPEEWIFDKTLSIPRWSVALVDHAPGEVRYEAANRLANICDYVIMHDTEPFGAGDYHWDRVKPNFKYWIDDVKYGAWTSVASNCKDLSLIQNLVEDIYSMCYRDDAGNLQRKV